MTQDTTTFADNGATTITFTVVKENDTAYQGRNFLPETIALSSSVLQHDRIAVDPNILNGEPYIRGTRIPVVVILDGLAEGLTPDELIEHYPRLTFEDIQAASKYPAVMAFRPAE